MPFCNTRSSLARSEGSVCHCDVGLHTLVKVLSRPKTPARFIYTPSVDQDVARWISQF